MIPPLSEEAKRRSAVSLSAASARDRRCEGREQCVSLREINTIPRCHPVVDWHSGCNRIVAESTRGSQHAVATIGARIDMQ
jgi:hypothetical protein